MSELQEPEIFRTVLETLPIGVYLVDRDRKIVFWNEGAERISGYLRHEVVGRARRSDIVVRCDDTGRVLSDSSCPVAETLLDGKLREARAYLKHKAGHRVPVVLRAMPVRDHRGCIIGAAETFSERLEPHRSDPLAELMAQYGCLDSKTGLPHHLFTLSRLSERLAIREEHHLPFGIFLLEVENEETLLAARGRDAANLALRSVSRTLKNSLCPSDFLGRWEGDRLLAILDRDPPGLEAAKQQVQELANLSEIEWWGDSLRVSVRLGVAQARSGDTPESLLDRAEQILARPRDTAAGREHNPREPHR
jgi:PAS domain S-box-containing protein/diguanylate cyclase (GGDEF)-like protein